MKTANDLLQIAAKSSITVLIQGESGTGKEVAARFLHRAGPRPGGPFIAVNCGAIAKNLIESTLEGAKRGAYTGATADQIGVVRAAESGTLFLDEIGELPYESQSRLLRILQERAVMPVGATRSIPVDFRLVCATNKNLKEDMELTCDLRQYAGYKVVDHIVLTNDDLKAVHTEKKPNTVAPVLSSNTKIEKGILETVLPSKSWNVIRLAK